MSRSATAEPENVASAMEVASAGAPPTRSPWRILAPPVQDLDYLPPDDVVDQDLQCCVCLGWPEDPVVLGCPGGHMLCRRCVTGQLCPLDRQPFARLSDPHLVGAAACALPRGCAGMPVDGPQEQPAGAPGDVPPRGARVRALRSSLAALGQGFAEHVLSDCADAPVAEAPPDPRSASAVVRSSAEAGTARREVIGRVIEAYEQAERLNVCFVVDCTGSMSRHIDAVKTQIRWIVHELRARLPSMQLHLAFVGYRDHCDACRVEVLPFTRSVDEFRDFVAGMRATGGGGDGPEDVHGALEKACELDWSINDAATRVIVHVADFPAHGTRYNDCPRDSYPGGDPRGLDLEVLVRQLRDLSVQYVFGHITDHTQKMTRVLNEALGDYIEDKDMMDVELVAEVVTASLQSSVASTVSTLTSSPGAEVLPPVVLSDAAPDWESIDAEEIVLQEVRRVADISSLRAGSDASLTRQVDQRIATVSIADLPFAQGESRVARHALRGDGSAAVAKHFKRRPEDGEEDHDGDAGLPFASTLDAHLTLSEVSAVAGFLAEAFNATREGGESIHFLASATAHGPNVVPCNLEDALPAGEFRRFSNNIGWWEPDAAAAAHGVHSLHARGDRRPPHGRGPPGRAHG
eukprot:CAMPEP_0115193286 /NCGR_PEP_ID=MMETSP0270-20121206/13474_1 /TAXON_ID=71861 /ORGANISM="Scrippsiella trochoidea, Strain CCMP3099" /LENGTH=632 /DNA_ID=CAMNT_0002606547 /DNA_START=54 /DNA_END=1949 /DNA_ORIENTATION=-